MMEEFYRYSQKEQALEVSKGEVVSVRKKSIVRQAARIFSEGAIRSVSCCGEMAESDLIQSAKQSKAPALPYRYQLPKGGHFSQNLSEHIQYIHAQLIIETSTQLEYLRSKAPNFLFSGKVRLTEHRKSLKNNQNLDCSIGYQIIGWDILYKHRKSASIIDGYFTGENILEGKNANPSWMRASIDQHLPLFNTFEKELSWNEETLPILFTEGLPDRLAFKLSESLRIDRYREGTAMFSGMLGEKIFGPEIALDDVSFVPNRGAVEPFDGEGTVRTSAGTALIENGAIVQLISDLRNGAKYGVPSTGNGKRVMESEITLDFNSLLLRPGTRGYREILRSIPRAVLAIVITGGAVTDTGEFSTPVQLAFLVEKGEIVGRLPQLTVRSNIRQMLGSGLVAVSKDSFGGGMRHPCFITEMRVLKN